MLYYKTQEEVEKIRQSSLLVARTLGKVAKHVRPGVSTLELDTIAETFIRDHNGVPGFKGYNGFPNTLCISPNDQVVHGIPSKAVLNDGDVVSVDCGVLLNGFYGDCAFTFVVGEIKPEVRNLLTVTRECLEKGIENAVEGKRLGDISWAIQDHAEKNGYSVVRELVGHGIGKKLHEKPEVPNYGKRGSGMVLKAGLILAIEPMINLGKRNIVQERDGWTIRTADKKPSAHFEHTVAIGKEKADVLSSFEFVDAAILEKVN
jgi:methionyl aminopeptidase